MFWFLFILGYEKEMVSMNTQKQKIVNWSEQALEILGTALLQNRNNMAYTMLSSTEMIVRCKEDNWRILMTEAGLFHLYHNNYVMVGETERRFTNGYHDQKVESANLQELINYIAGYSWDKHLQSRGIEVDKTIFKIRTIKNGEISRSILLKRNQLNEYTFFPYKNCIRDVLAFERKKKRMQKVMMNILIDGKNSSYELFCVIDESKKAIYIAEGVFNVYWQYIRCEKVDLSQISLRGKKAFLGRDFKIQYTGILESEQETQNLISRRNNALEDEKYKYVVSDMDNWVHHKSCKKVDDIKYWEFEALEEIPVGRKVCPCCQDKIYTRGEYITTSDTEMQKDITVKRGDVYYADLIGIEQSIGCEQTGKRPVLVIQNDVENIDTKKEGIEVALMYNETIYDNQENNWMHMIERHMEFYSNIEQYMSNLKIEQEKLEREIEELLVFMEENNCNAAQGFKLYKFLRDRRIRRKEIIKELQLLEVWTETIECQQMQSMYQQAIGKMQQIKAEQERVCPVHNFFEEAS